MYGFMTKWGDFCTSHGLVGREFANGLGDQGSITGWVISKTQENGTWYLLA